MLSKIIKRTTTTTNNNIYKNKIIQQNAKKKYSSFLNNVRKQYNKNINIKYSNNNNNNSNIYNNNNRNEKFINNIIFKHRYHTTSIVNGKVEFKLADIGEGIAEVEVMQWFIKEGDTIEQFQNICEVQSDKATVEITSRYDGVITKVHYEVGELAQVGTALIDIEVEGEVETEAPASKKEPAAAKPTPPPATTKPIETISVVQQSAPSHSSAPAAATATTSTPPSKGGKVLATPAVRRLATEHDVDISTVLGTGKGGRVTKSDLLMYVQEKRNQHHAQQQQPHTSTATSTANAVGSGEIPEKRNINVVQGVDQDVPIRGIQRLMVQSMKESLKIPHFGYYDEVDMTSLMEIRKMISAVGEKEGIKITYLPIMIKAASAALNEYPTLNSYVSKDESTQTIKSAHNIGLAMDTPRGLLVPNVKNCEQRSILDIAYEINRLQALGTANKLGEEELTGGTFTLSNIGSIGGTYASPVILAPQVAIGALGKIRRVPRFDENDNVVAANMMSVSWSADHRVIDGATMARFSNLWKDMLENPETMLVNLK